MGGWRRAPVIALFCALRAESLEEGVILAANITGDSDLTGAITGNLMGAMLGAHEIPQRWLAHLELKEVIAEMADDLASVEDWLLAEPGQEARENAGWAAYWSARYPGW